MTSHCHVILAAVQLSFMAVAAEFLTLLLFVTIGDSRIDLKNSVKPE